MRLSKLFVLLLLIGLSAALPVSTAATNVIAWCSGSTPPDPLPPDNYLTLNDAVNALASSPVGPHTIFVLGTCHNEGVQIIGFNRLTITTPPGETAVISQDQVTSCAQPFPPNTGTPALRIIDSHSITIAVRGFPPSGSIVFRGGSGISIEDSSVVMSGVTVENSRGGGIGLGNASSLSLNGRINNGPAPNVLQNNCGGGIGTGFNSTVNINNAAVIQNNGVGIGVGGFVQLNGGPDASTQIVIQNNLGPGLTVINPGSVASVSGRVLIQNNSSNPSFPVFTGGIVVTSGLLSINAGGVQILNNSGPGIWLDMQAKLRLGPPVNGTPGDFTISGNTEEGVRILHMSVAWSNSGSISGNSVADVTCDATSLLFGNVTGIAVNKCSSTEAAKKK